MEAKRRKQLGQIDGGPSNPGIILNGFSFIIKSCLKFIKNFMLKIVMFFGWFALEFCKDFYLNMICSKTICGNLHRI